MSLNEKLTPYALSSKLDILLH